MRWQSVAILLVVAVAAVLPCVSWAEAADCPQDSVPSGTICVDKYEASVWKTADAHLVHKIRKGSVTLQDLTSAGAIQLGGLTAGDLVAAGCPVTGNGCTAFYAVSIEGVQPAAHISWFQAAAAARNAGKRLPTNAEWQVAALGTPDGLPCRVTGGPVVTGTPGCVSDVGAFDMVGNLSEWVADWVPLSTACPGWAQPGFPNLSDDSMCLAGANSSFGPGALFRGGDFSLGTGAGVFAINGLNNPFLDVHGTIGFRAAR